MKSLSLPLLFSLLVFGTSKLDAQKISGFVSDNMQTLIGVSITVEELNTGTSTDEFGYYELKLKPGAYTITASYIGYISTSKKVVLVENKDLQLDFDLSQGVLVDEIVVTGTRYSERTDLESAVPVDVIDIDAFRGAIAQTNVNQMLHYSAPSFSSNTQTISDGTDHIDPASLRGLGPDQVLVLVNGKRRHTSSLINVNGTFGRGNVGTDMNAIPMSAIDEIEVLRDGAAAQYGSDAIAGVINIKLKEDTEAFNFSMMSGANMTDRIGAFDGTKKQMDGENFLLTSNYGLSLGEKGGFFNISGELEYRGSNNRMLSFDGPIFNKLNGIERLGSQTGINAEMLTLQNIQELAGQLPYFHNEDLQMISSAESIEAIQNILLMDVTEEELAARSMQRSDFNMRTGQSKFRSAKLFANLSMPISDNAQFYAFGGLTQRFGESVCFYRLPNQIRTLRSIYPEGTVPRINSSIDDASLSMGINSVIGSWNTDYSFSYGKNQFLYNLSESHNATLGVSSPTDFFSGGHSFSQTTGNVDFSQYFDGMGNINGLNMAFGAEYRLENYMIMAGEEESYETYDINGNKLNNTTSDDLVVYDLFGNRRPGGAQCFPGFQPANEVVTSRSSIGFYVDTEADLSDQLLVGAAMRLENYSDFGTTFNYKLTGRYSVLERYAFRAAFSTGFRAPSLHQLNFSRTSTIFTLENGISIPQEVGIFSNNSRVAEILGIPRLKQEISRNYSAGVTAKIPVANLRMSLDVYQIDIEDRVILTGQFEPGSNMELQNLFNQANATRAAFFANAIDTNTKGLDLVIAHSSRLGRSNTIRNELVASFTQTYWNQDNGINASDILRESGLVDTYFDQSARIFLEQALPRTQLSLSHHLNFEKFDVFIRNNYFGSTTEATNANIFDNELNLIDVPVDPYYEPRIITDFSLSYELKQFVHVTLGANNIFDVFPEKTDPLFASQGRFPYSRTSPQFSIGGRFVFCRLNLLLK